MKGTNEKVTWIGAVGAGLAFLGPSLMAIGGKFVVIGAVVGAVGGACSAMAFYFAKGKDVTGGTLQQ